MPDTMPTRESVLNVIATSHTAPSIPQIATALNYYTNTPWEIVFIVRDLVVADVVEWVKRRPNGRKMHPWRVRLTTTP